MSDRLGVWEQEGSFDDRIESARKAIGELARCLEATDEPATIVAVVRLRHALEIAERSAVAIGVAQTDDHASASEALRAIQQVAYPLLDRAPTQLHGSVAFRRTLARLSVVSSASRYRRTPTARVDASGQTLVSVSFEAEDLTRARFSGATLRDVHLGTKLDEVEALGSILVRLHAEAASMRRANFDGCLVEKGRFARSNLEASTWRGAQVYWCSFADCTLADARCDGAMFVECNFRGANLGAVRGGPHARISRVKFLRCDLRGARWNGRDFAEVSFQDCKLHGIRGQARVDGLQIERPDISAAGDGSAIATPTYVLEQLEKPGWP